MLLLRKACQPILNKYGLEGLHIRLTTENSPRMTIVTKCDRQLVTIYSIQFNGGVIDKETRDYAVELFEEYVNIHHKVIVNYVKCMKHYREVTENKKPLPSNVTIYRKGNHNNLEYLLKVNVGSKRPRYSIHPDGSIEITGGIRGTTDEITKKVKALRPKIGQYLEFITQEVEIQKARIAENKAMSELSRCSR